MEDDLAFGGGEVDWPAFDAMCKDKGLQPRTQETVSAEAALAWIAQTSGVTLVSFSLPRDEKDVRTAFRIAVEQARNHGLVLEDPQAGATIDLDAPGDLPPMW